MTNSTIDALMLDYAWTVHDFQHLAHSLSLLVTAIGADTFEERNFYGDVELLTMGMAPETARHAAVLKGLTGEDKAALLRLKNDRDRLINGFFIEHRIDRPNAADVAARARGHLEEIRAAAKHGRTVLDRAYALVAEVGDEED